jgi:hypothetical protein
MGCGSGGPGFNGHLAQSFRMCTVRLWVGFGGARLSVTIDGRRGRDNRRPRVAGVSRETFNERQVAW